MKPGDELLALFDSQIAVAESRLAKLREARAQVASIYDEPARPAAEPATEILHATPPTRGRGRQKAGKAPRHTRAASADPVEVIYGWLKKQKSPVTIADLVDGTALSKYHVKKALSTLLDSEQIVAAGIKSHYRIGLPAVMAAAAKEEL